MKRALISVYDKNGILDFAKFLIDQNIEIISTGGTFKYFKENNIPVKEISEVTNFPEMLDGRVKTLHPNIHGGILAIRDNENHMNAIREKKIDTIDIVIVNLYPFFEKVNENISFEEKVEFIDIGGPTMLRSAAKSFRDVIVISDICDYEMVKSEMKSGTVSLNTKKILAGKVFNLTSAYDAAISNFLLDEKYPNYLSLSYEKKMNLRYGENPHQNAAYYVSTVDNGAMKDFDILNGKELSFNNIRDMDVAWKVVCEFDTYACCGVKHSTPCGVAIGSSAYDAYLKAYNCDPTSIFGGIIAINKTVDKSTAEEIIKIFLEIVIAPNFDNDALEILKTKKNLRVIKCNNSPLDKMNIVKVDGGILIQDEDTTFSNDFKVVTTATPTEKEMNELKFALKVVKYAKSNAIVVAKDGMAIGIGNGETNRIWATNQALERAKNGTVIASDAFFPFRDVVDEAAKYGIKAIIQPGGSIRDSESIEACNEHGISMIFTGIRHFKH
ncbi:phosphoribosylaminoimidazolecarboxamide formyltransferase/IMP cyclohydrolase [Fusobacterium sp. PH5-44]